MLSSLLIESTKLYGQLTGALTETEARNAELLRSRSALAQAQRMDAIGQLTGGIAHDFDNLLTAICGSLELISRKADDRERVVRLAEAALELLRQGERIDILFSDVVRLRGLFSDVVRLRGLPSRIGLDAFSVGRRQFMAQASEHPLVLAARPQRRIQRHGSKADGFMRL